MCKRFTEACGSKGVALPPRPEFTLSYTTTIPRQAGLSGSSAILAAGVCMCVGGGKGLGGRGGGC
jgi:glucuronokinase